MDVKVIDGIDQVFRESCERYVVLVRYGNNYWATHSIHSRPEEVLENFTLPEGATCWRIVRVQHLPIEIEGNQV